jgi:hypothetical protein
MKILIVTASQLCFRISNYEDAGGAEGIGIGWNMIIPVSVCADDINLLGESTNSIGKTKERGNETDKMKCMLMSRPQNTGANHNMKTDYKHFENATTLRYLETH